MSNSWQGKQLESNQHARARPYKATVEDEYSIIRESSEDFVDIRRVLVQMPLLKKHTLGRESHDGEVAFTGSIFETILEEKRAADNQLTNDSKLKQMKDSGASVHSGEKSDISDQTNTLFISTDNDRSNSHSQTLNRLNPKDGVSDSWNRFNTLLLKLLNTYMKQIRNYEDQMIEESDQLEREPEKGRQIKRFSQQNLGPRTKTDPNYHSNGPTRGVKNLLTFACMVQDANPSSNLTFDWSFGSAVLPESDGNNFSSPFSGRPTGRDRSEQIHLYTNRNSSVRIVFVRRFDSNASLSPFQMSLVTLKVVVDPSLQGTSLRQTEPNYNTNTTNQGLLRAPSAKIRSNSIYNNLKSGQDGSNNIQFSNEFSLKTPYNIDPSLELDEFNWQAQIGNLLKCSVTNSVGTSEICHVQVNLAERLKNQSASSEYAKWRMPSLGQRSLLILSILVGCCLIIFASFGLFLGQYLKSLDTKKEELDHSKEETNIAQSTSSQKSSVLGLLGNGDSSMQGSSDDDSSNRLNHLDTQARLQGRMRDSDDTLGADRMMTNGYHQHHHLMRESINNYDKPRVFQENRLVHQESGNNYRSTGPQNLHQNRFDIDGSAANHMTETPPTLDNRNSNNSATSRLLASLRLRSLTKLKVDRIAGKNLLVMTLTSYRYES